MHDCKYRKPRYSQLLSKQSDRRQKEGEIVYERKFAKERAKDQHLFQDQVKVVTGPYKRKLEEREQWLSEERLRQLLEEKDDVTKKTNFSDLYFNIGKNVTFGAYFNIGKNVTFGAPDIKARSAKRFKEHIQEDLGKEETREDKKTGDIGSTCRKSMEPQEADQTASEKKMGSDAKEKGDSSILVIRPQVRLVLRFGINGVLDEDEPDPADTKERENGKNEEDDSIQCSQGMEGGSMTSHTDDGGSVILPSARSEPGPRMVARRAFKSKDSIESLERKRMKRLMLLIF